ncbi:hypothetical protein [Chitinophaga sp. CF418]|uniref:hypothetical protein n=1 Tax=Chitinophaga sp. CF418 TaxID=1855287 RepID=UPI000916E970|nr:hypothetical protein [Chitinophaga sp. CF418]SHN45340.1 hypothetical protein SAMN05216311_119127 [Chitinophaga sp. CF418]
MKNWILVFGGGTIIVTLLTAHFTYKHDDTAVYMCAVIASAMSILTLITAQKKQDEDERENKRLTSVQINNLENLNEATERAEKSEKEFRLYMTGGGAIPKLTVNVIRRIDIAAIGPFVELQLNIENPGDYPLHQVNIQISDLFGYELYNQVRIYRSLTNGYTFNSKPKHIDISDYKSTQEVHLPTIPKKSTFIPIYTTCYRLIKDHEVGPVVHITWSSGSLVFYLIFSRDETSFEFVKLPEVVLNGDTLKDDDDKHFTFTKREFNA